MNATVEEIKANTQGAETPTAEPLDKTISQKHATEPTHRRALVPATLEIREIGDEASPVVYGTANIYGEVIDYWGELETFAPGAFTEELAISGNRVKLLNQHHSREILGVPVVTDLPNALQFECPIIMGTTWAPSTVALMKGKALTDVSVGFDVVDSHVETRNGEAVRIITKAKLWEISIVTWGAYEQPQAALRSALRTLSLLSDSLADASTDEPEQSGDRDGERKWSLTPAERQTLRNLLMSREETPVKTDEETPKTANTRGPTGSLRLREMEMKLKGFGNDR